MKQSITKEQWEELPESLKEEYDKYWYDKYPDTYKASFGLSIGYMIEFLDLDFKDWLDEKLYIFKEGEIYIWIKFEGKGWEQMIFCDALWIAVKHKLNNSGDN